jgi:hypothetical protein
VSSAREARKEHVELAVSAHIPEGLLDQPENVSVPDAMAVRTIIGSVVVDNVHDVSDITQSMLPSALITLSSDDTLPPVTFIVRVDMLTLVSFEPKRGGTTDVELLISELEAVGSTGVELLTSELPIVEDASVGPGLSLDVEGSTAG